MSFCHRKANSSGFSSSESEVRRGGDQKGTQPGLNSIWTAWTSTHILTTELSENKSGLAMFVGKGQPHNPWANFTRQLHAAGCQLHAAGVHGAPAAATFPQQEDLIPEAQQDT